MNGNDDGKGACINFDALSLDIMVHDLETSLIFSNMNKHRMVDVLAYRKHPHGSAPIHLDLTPDQVRTIILGLQMALVRIEDNGMSTKGEGTSSGSEDSHDKEDEKQHE